MYEKKIFIFLVHIELCIFVIGKAASVSVPKEKSTWKVVFWEVLKLIKQIS